MVLTLTGYRVTLHRADCSYFLLAQHRDLPFPRSVRFIKCKKCRPADDDIRAAIPDWAETVSWFEYSGGRGRIRIVPWFEGVEEVAARRSLGWGRALPAPTRWAS